MTHHAKCPHHDGADFDPCICATIHEVEQHTAEIIASRIGDYEQSLTSRQARDIAMNCRMLAVAV